MTRHVIDGDGNIDGEGNFKALFESIEAQQIADGELQPVATD